MNKFELKKLNGKVVKLNSLGYSKVSKPAQS